MQNELLKYLEGGDLRSIGNVDKLLPLIKTRSDFDNLFEHLFSKNRLVVMRTVDALEKISATRPGFLRNHKLDVLNFMQTAKEKEFKWHLSLMVSRLDLTSDELDKVWQQLTKWAMDKNESRIVRVNSIQSLYNLAKLHKGFKTDLNLIVQEIRKEKIPSLNARFRKLDQEKLE